MRAVVRGPASGPQPRRRPVPRADDQGRSALRF